MIHNTRPPIVIIKHMVVLNRLYYDRDKVDTNICALSAACHCRIVCRRIHYKKVRQNIHILYTIDFTLIYSIL